MPTVGIVAAIGATAASATAGIYGANKSSQANEQASQLTNQSNAAAIAEQQRQDAQQKAEFDAQQTALTNQWNAEQAIRAPYRAAGASALSKVGDILGVNFNSGNSPSYTTPAAPTLPSTTTTPTSSTTPAGSTPSTNLSDPAAWMSLVSNTPQLTQWVQSQGVTNPNDVSYYVSKIQGQPGANAQEQANGAGYWSQKIKGAYGGTTTPISSVMPSSSQLAPSSLAMPSANALAPTYGQVVPISAMMGG